MRFKQIRIPEIKNAYFQRAQATTHSFVPYYQTVQLDGVIGLEGSTRMDQNRHVSSQGEALGGFRVQINIL